MSACCGPSWPSTVLRLPPASGGASAEAAPGATGACAGVSPAGCWSWGGRGGKACCGCCWCCGGGASSSPARSAIKAARRAGVPAADSRAPRELSRLGGKGQQVKRVRPQLPQFEAAGSSHLPCGSAWPTRHACLLPIATNAPGAMSAITSPSSSHLPRAPGGAGRACCGCCCCGTGRCVCWPATAVASPRKWEGPAAQWGMQRDVNRRLGTLAACRTQENAASQLVLALASCARLAHTPRLLGANGDKRAWRHVGHHIALVRIRLRRVLGWPAHGRRMLKCRRARLLVLHRGRRPAARQGRVPLPSPALATPAAISSPPPAAAAQDACYLCRHPRLPSLGALLLMCDRALGVGAAEPSGCLSARSRCWLDFEDGCQLSLHRADASPFGLWRLARRAGHGTSRCHAAGAHRLEAARLALQQ